MRQQKNKKPSFENEPKGDQRPKDIDAPQDETGPSPKVTSNPKSGLAHALTPGTAPISFSNLSSLYSPADAPSEPRAAQARIERAFSPLQESEVLPVDPGSPPPVEHPNIGWQEKETLHEDSAVRIRFLRGGSKVLFVSFTGIGHDLGGLNPDEFAGTAFNGGKNSALFISDMRRSWYNHSNIVPHVLRAVWTVQNELKPSKIVTIGNSMGGFGAILFSRMIGASVTIAMSPQFSVKKDIVPDERRWMQYRHRIKVFRYPDISSAFGPKTNYFIFSGTAPEELRHTDRLPDARHIRKFYIEDQGHTLAMTLKKRKIQKQIISYCYNLPPVIADMRIRRILKNTFGDVTGQL